MKPALHQKCAGLCDLEYADTKQLFGEDISKSLVRAKEVEGFRKQFQPEPDKNSQGWKYQNIFKHYSPKDSYKSSHQYEGSPQARNNRNRR